MVSLRDDQNLSAKGSAKLGPEFEARMTEICRAIREKYGLLPVLVPMQNGHDLAICRGVARDSGGVTIENISAKELAGIVVGAEFVLGMRLHIIVYAAASAIPPIAICYDPKISSMMKYLEQSHTVDVFDASCETVLPMVEDIVKNRFAIRVLLARRAVELQKLARGDAEIAIDLLK